MTSLLTTIDSLFEGVLAYGHDASDTMTRRILKCSDHQNASRVG